MLVIPLASTTDVNPAQPSNTAVSILDTLPGISIVANALQSMNAHSPMLVTLSGIVIEVNDVQLRNA